MTRRVYLDHNATVPIRPEVLDTMSEVLQIGGNASSVHAEGRKARQGASADCKNYRDMRCRAEL